VAGAYPLFTSEEEASVAEFKGLAIDPIYTLAMDVPSSWLARPREARYDLDNIQLGHLSSEHPIVHAGFELDYLVIEGHARQVNTNSPPRGVQLELVRESTSGSTPVDDTQVVANLGYFQFKAKPGVLQLGIRQGRGREIFKMESAGNEGWDSPKVEEVGSEITLTSFEGLTLFPRLARLAGMEAADVLEEVRNEQGFTGVLGDIVSKSVSFWLCAVRSCVLTEILGRVTSLFKPKESSTAPSEVQADINIFTVASGLLYEVCGCSSPLNQLNFAFSTL
jgi:UDP-glucose:glycoprotein glucosyltransferase